MTTEETPNADEVATLPNAVVTAEAPTRLEQRVDIIDAGPCKKHVKVTIAGAIVRGRFEEKYSELMTETPAHVPGFRPGKAPRKIVEKKFSKEVAAEVRREVLMASLEQLAEDELLSPLSSPRLDPNAVIMPEDGGDMVYEFDIEVRPDFDVPNYKGLKIRRPVHHPTAEDIAHEKRRILEPLATLVDKPGPDARLALGDVMVADIVLRKGDRVLNSFKDVNLKIEKRLALEDGVAEDFGRDLTGAGVGDQRTVVIRLSGERVNGEALADFTVRGVKQLQYPELTPAVLGQFNVRTPEAFDILIETRLNRNLEYFQRQLARRQVWEQLAGTTNWELPEDLLKAQAQKTLIRKVLEMRSAGMSEDQIRRREKTMARDVINNTAAVLREQFVLQKIAELEKIEVNDADLDAEIEAMAERMDEPVRKLRARLQREDAMESLATELLERKALDLILASAEYEDYEFNPHGEDDGGAAEVGTSISSEATG